MVLDAPTPPELGHLSRTELRDRLWQSFGYGAPGWTPPIRPWPGPISEIYYGWLDLGRDVNGTTLHSERDSWLKANGWAGPGDLEAGHFFFAVLEAESAEVHQILYPPHGK